MNSQMDTFYYWQREGILVCIELEKTIQNTVKEQSNEADDPLT